MVTVADIEGYLTRQVAAGRTRVAQDFGTVTADAALTIPTGIRGIDFRGTKLVFNVRPNAWAPLNVVNHTDLDLRNLDLIDNSASQSADGRPGVFTFNSSNIRYSRVFVTGFQPCAVHRDSSHVTVKSCTHTRSGSWNVLFDNCTDIVVNRGGSTFGWLDGYKMENCDRWQFNDVEMSDNGVSAITDPTSNGNGIDTFPGSKNGVLRRCKASRNKGAAFNIKSGPADAILDESDQFVEWRPTNNIVLIDVEGHGNEQVLVDVNNTSAESKGAIAGYPAPTFPHDIIIDGLKGTNNSTQGTPTGRTVRVGDGNNIAFEGVWEHDGTVFVTAESTNVTQNQREVSA